MTDESMAVPASVRAAYGLASVADAPHGIGLINLTVRASGPAGEVVLQRQHPAFAAPVVDDIHAITERLVVAGVTTPRLVLTRDGARCFIDEHGRVWRALTYLAGGASHAQVGSPAHAAEAGAATARFHGALDGFTHAYAHVRPGIHDLDFRRARLEAAAAAHPQHRLAATVAAARQRVSGLEPHLLTLATCIARAPLRHAHGDLKISNVLFDERGKALALVDLDTLAQMPWVFEMGDALRSWCNPADEDDPSPRFDEPVFAAALEGYRATSSETGRLLGSNAVPSPAERADLVAGVVTIATELAIRFLTDALEESYFGFDRTRFARAGEHNLLRALGQLALAEAVVARRPALEAIVARTL